MSELDELETNISPFHQSMSNIPSSDFFLESGSQTEARTRKDSIEQKYPVLTTQSFDNQVKILPTPQPDKFEPVIESLEAVPSPAKFQRQVSTPDLTPKRP